MLLRILGLRRNTPRNDTDVGARRVTAAVVQGEFGVLFTALEDVGYCRTV
eukprot:COSAG06_NODE_5261_length_3601_cov_3.816729_2_plen_50_part_00